MKCGAKCEHFNHFIMVLYRTVILALLVHQYAATLLPGQNSDHPLNVRDLAELIQKVADDVMEDEKPMHRQALDMDYFSTDDTHRAVLDSIMTLLGKNFLTQTQDEGVRVHVIKNPQVLQEYKDGLRRRRPYRLRNTTPKTAHQWDSDGPLSDLSSLARNDYSDQDENGGVFRRKNGLRRNRIDDGSGDKKHSTESKNKREQGNISSDNEQFIHFITKRESEQRDKEEKKSRSNEIENQKKSQDIEKYNRAEKGKDSKEWDVITKKWDNEDKRDKKDDTEKHKTVDKRDKIDNKWGEKRQRADEDWKPSKLRNKWSNNKSDNSGKWEDKLDVAKAKIIRESFIDDKPEEYKVMKVDWKIKDKTETTYGMPTYRTTKDRNRGKQYVPKMSDYYQPSKPRHHKGNGYNKNFGRTSIPFVGKKGIYEE